MVISDDYAAKVPHSDKETSRDLTDRHARLIGRSP